MRIVQLGLVGIALACTTAAPASQKPCRDRDGKVVTCPGPKTSAAPRCKDDKGRFVSCKQPAPAAVRR